MKRFICLFFLFLSVVSFADTIKLQHAYPECPGPWRHEISGDETLEGVNHHITCNGGCTVDFWLSLETCPICNPYTPPGPDNPDPPDNPDDPDKPCPHCGSLAHSVPSPNVCGCIIQQCSHCGENKPCQHLNTVHDCGCVSSVCDHCKKTIKCQHVKDDHVCNCIRTYCEHCHQQDGCQHEHDYDHDCGCIGGETCDHCGERKGCQHDPQHKCICIPYRCDHCRAQVACQHLYDEHDCGCSQTYCPHCKSELPCQHVKNDHNCGCVYVTCDHCGGRKGCQHESSVDHNCGCRTQYCDHCHASKGCQHQPAENHDCGCVRQSCSKCGADIGCQHQTVVHNCDEQTGSCHHCGSLDHTVPSVSACGCRNLVVGCSHCGSKKVICFDGFKDWPCSHKGCSYVHEHEPPCRKRTCPNCKQEYCASHDVHKCDDTNPNPPDEPDDIYDPPDPGDFDVSDFKFINLLKQKIHIDLPSSFEPYSYNFTFSHNNRFIVKIFYDYGLSRAVHYIFNMGSSNPEVGGMSTLPSGASMGIAEYCRSLSIILMSIIFIIAIIKSVKKNS